MFKGIKDNWKKAEAAAIVQTLLEDLAALGLFSGDAAKIANAIVEAAWNTNTELFDGRYGQRPHKLSLAASSLAIASENLKPDGELLVPVMLALGQVLTGIDQKAMLLPLSPLDHMLLGKARRTFDSHPMTLEAIA